MTHQLRSQMSPAQYRWRIVEVVIPALLLILGLLWILSLLHFLDSSWATFLGTIFTMLGVLLALASWLWPRSSAPASSSQGQGELEVLVRPELCGSTVYIDGGFHEIPPHNGRAATISERHNGNTVECAAEDQALPPGNYTVSINANEPVAHVTILIGQRKRIDWRRIRP